MKTEHPRALREVPVVADVHADLADGGVEHGVPHVPRTEVELLPEPIHVRDVRFSVFAEVFPVCIDDRGGVVVDADLVFLVHRYDQHHRVLLGELLHELRRRTVGNFLRVAVVLGVLHLAEIRTVEELLQAHDLRALLRGVGDVFSVPLDHRVLVAGPGALDEGGFHGRH